MLKAAVREMSDILIRELIRQVMTGTAANSIREISILCSESSEMDFSDIFTSYSLQIQYTISGQSMQKNIFSMQDGKV